MLLHAFDSLVSSNSLKHGIRSESFPITATFWLASNGTDRWTEPDIDAFTSRFLAYGNSTLVHELLVKRGSSGYAVRKHSNMVCLADSIRRIFEAKLRNTNSKS